MSEKLSVKVSSRHQIAVPAAARKHLNVKSGDRLIVDIQDGMILLLPQPNNFTRSLLGLHKEIWQGLNTEQLIDDERDAWQEK